MTSAFDLSGKTALVTGCKRGIGRGMAEALAAAGADIIGVSASLELTGSEVGKTGSLVAACGGGVVAVKRRGAVVGGLASARGPAADFVDRAADVNDGVRLRGGV